jgi:xylan 1,4-beta-xylosidase
MLPDAVQGDAVTPPIGLPDSGIVQLRAEIDEERLRFAWKCGSGDWRWLPQLFDASILSDEATLPGAPNFTGAFVGMCCQDVAGTLKHADFDYFIYRERPYRVDPKAD